MSYDQFRSALDDGKIVPGGNLTEIFETWRGCAARDELPLAIGWAADGMAGGVTTRAAYERLREEFLAGLTDAGQVDIVLLLLHGAMMADGCDDVEGDVLQAVRERLPEAVIGVLLDPHCHLTDHMVDASDLIVLAREYPHTDFVPRARELYDACFATWRGAIRPTPAVFDCHMIGFFQTTIPPMEPLVRALDALNTAPGVVSASFVHGFELGDTADLGAKILVYADGDAALAEATARGFGERVYRQRRELIPHIMTGEAALDAAFASERLAVIADMGDNPGAGAAGDNVELLRLALDRQGWNIVAGCIWDPMVVAMARDAGIGGVLTVRVGGKTGSASGDPLDLQVTVGAITDALQQPSPVGGVVAMGAAVRLDTPQAKIVVIDRRTQTFAPEAFTAMGIDLAATDVILIKSGEHFRSGFASLDPLILHAAAPATIGLDFAAIPHRHRTLDYFPRVLDPLGLDATAETG